MGITQGVEQTWVGSTESVQAPSLQKAAGRDRIPVPGPGGFGILLFWIVAALGFC